MTTFAQFIEALNKVGQVANNHSHARPFKKGGIARFTIDNGARERICFVIEDAIHSINFMDINNDGTPVVTTNAWLIMNDRASKEDYIKTFNEKVLPYLSVERTKLEEIHWFDFTA